MGRCSSLYDLKRESLRLINVKCGLNATSFCISTKLTASLPHTGSSQDDSKRIDRRGDNTIYGSQFEAKRGVQNAFCKSDNIPLPRSPILTSFLSHDIESRRTETKMSPFS
jgi:hypothetical protein